MCLFVFSNRSILCIATLTGNIPESSEIRITSYIPDMQHGGPHGVHIRGVPLYYQTHVCIQQVFGYLPVLGCCSDSCLAAGCSTLKPSKTSTTCDPERNTVITVFIIRCLSIPILLTGVFSVAWNLGQARAKGGGGGGAPPPPP